MYRRGKRSIFKICKNIIRCLEKRQKSEGMKSPEDFLAFLSCLSCYDENITKFYVNIKC